MSAGVNIENVLVLLSSSASTLWCVGAPNDALLQVSFKSENGGGRDKEFSHQRDGQGTNVIQTRWFDPKAAQ
jgi:hypothetical protein